MLEILPSIVTQEKELLLPRVSTLLSARNSKTWPCHHSSGEEESADWVVRTIMLEELRNRSKHWESTTEVVDTQCVVFVVDPAVLCPDLLLRTDALISGCWEYQYQLLHPFLGVAFSCRELSCPQPVTGLFREMKDQAPLPQFESTLKVHAASELL